jgi:hypothetical protein
MRWESEKWRKLYRRVDASWLRLPALARGLGSELLKYAEDDGRIAVMEDEETGEAVCRLMGAHKTERKAVAELAGKLLADGYLVRESGAILIRNFVKAQARSSSAERQARFRKRHGEQPREDDGDDHEGVTHQEAGDADRDVTGGVTSNGHRNAPVTGTVTQRSDGSRSLSLSLSSEISGSLSADPQKELPVIASARDSEPHANGAGQLGLLGAAPVEPPAAKRVRRAKPAPAVEPHPMPAEWAPTAVHAAYATKHGLDLETEVFGFRGWAEGKAQVSWNGAFSTRLANTVKWARERAGSGGRASGNDVQRAGGSRVEAEARTRSEQLTVPTEETF